MSSCCSKKKRFDYLLWGSALVIVVSYLLNFTLSDAVFTASVFELINRMWWGLLIGVFFVGVLDVVPREFLVKVLGRGGTFGGILRATGAGILLDLCSHGILIVGMKLYQRGASLGQVMAFLIASPWNSFSLTLVLWALIGFKWMMAFLVISMVIAVISGLIFELLVRRGVLPKNPTRLEPDPNFKFGREFRKLFVRENFALARIGDLFVRGLKGSRMIMRWILFGVILASLLRTFLDASAFETAFGPTLAGLGLTVLVATILEVCSEGSAPVAADILTRAGAPGNSLAFLMTGVATDYTEIISLKETTRSWKIAFFLPLVTLPQVIAVAVVLNLLN